MTRARWPGRGEPTDDEIWRELTGVRLERDRTIDWFDAPGARSRGAGAGRGGDPPAPSPEAAARAARRNQEAKTARRDLGHATDIKVDRISSAWLIRRFIDPSPVQVHPAKAIGPPAGEVRFDMFEAEYTHVGDRCTFETLLRGRATDRALEAIGEIVHDIDCKDDKFGRAEAAGIAALIGGWRGPTPTTPSGWSAALPFSRASTPIFPVGRERAPRNDSRWRLHV